MLCDFSACCVASGEPAQIHKSICKMKMEFQKEIWTSRYNDMGCGPPWKITSYMDIYRE